MYKVFLGKVLLPVTPSKITTKISNQNQTMTLLDGSEINQIKPAGLSEISFTCLLPGQVYPFARYQKEMYAPNYYLDWMEDLKKNQKKFQFIITRILPNNKRSYKTNITVTLEEYQVEESAENGLDIEVSLKLKQYTPYGTVVVKIEKDKKGETTIEEEKNRPSNQAIPNTYTVKKGDTLWAIAKKLLGDGAKCWNLAKLNKLSNPNILKIGQVLQIQDVPATTAPATKTTKTTSAATVKTAQSSLPKTVLSGASIGTMGNKIAKNTPSLTGASGQKGGTLMDRFKQLNKNAVKKLYAQ